MVFVSPFFAFSTLLSAGVALGQFASSVQESEERRSRQIQQESAAAKEQRRAESNLQAARVITGGVGRQTSRLKTTDFASILAGVSGL